MSSARKAILFDFDGTLAPNLDLPGMRQQVLRLTQQFNVPAEIYANQYIVEVIDHAYLWLRNNASASTDADADADAYFSQAHQLIIDIEISAAQNTTPFPMALTTLAELREANFALGIVTRNCRKAILTVVPALEACVDTIVARDDAKYLKPDPRHLKQALEDIGADPQHSAIVGDGHLDMLAGKQLGIRCIGVLTGSGTYESLTEAGADHIANALHATSLLEHWDLSSFQY